MEQLLCKHTTYVTAPVRCLVCLIMKCPTFCMEHQKNTHVRSLGSLIPACERQVCFADVSVRVL